MNKYCQLRDRINGIIRLSSNRMIYQMCQMCSRKTNEKAFIFGFTDKTPIIKCKEDTAVFNHCYYIKNYYFRKTLM